MKLLNIGILLSVAAVSIFCAHTEDLPAVCVLPYRYDNQGQMHILLSQFKGRYNLLQATPASSEKTVDVVKKRILENNKIDCPDFQKNSRATIEYADGKSATLFFVTSKNTYCQKSYLKWFLITPYNKDKKKLFEKQNIIITDQVAVVLNHPTFDDLLNAR